MAAFAGGIAMSNARVASLLVVVLAIVGCATSAPGGKPATPQYTIEQFLANTSVVGSSFAPDNSTILASADTTGIFNVYAYPVGGGEPEQLTHSTTESLRAIGYFPFDKRFLYFADKGGNENHHIFVRELDGAVKDLTPGDKTRAVFLDWAHDGKSFFVKTNERDARYMDLYEYSARDYTRKKLYEDKVGMDLELVSPDKRKAVLVKTHTTNDNDLYLLDLRSGKQRHLTPHQGDVSHGAGAFSIDGRHLLYTTDQGNEFAQLARMELKNGRTEPLLKTEWDVAYASLSQQGKYLVVGINNDGRTELRVYTAADMQQVALPTVPNAEISSVVISRDESHIAYYVTNSRVPRDLFAMPLAGGTPKQLTRTLSPAIDPANLAEGQVVRFASYDGVQIPGILYKPHGAAPNARVPALVWVHGGPGGQSRIGYSSLIQYLVNHGYAVYAINNRGSSGYGKTFYAMDDRKHGEADLGDVVASKKMLIGTGYVDPQRIGILGGSYGGYMVLAALAYAPDEFAVGVDIFGVANWVRTLESIPPYWESFRLALYKELGDPKTDGERLRRISPLFHPQKIRKPLIVLQGANDPRVLKVESDEIVAAIKANGVPHEYVVFDDEGHGFSKKANQLRGWQAILDFLDKHLKTGA
jgi:dipeptidyl aminopeptidase/acylaminoacyl peptidase